MKRSKKDKANKKAEKKAAQMKGAKANHSTPKEIRSILEKTWPTKGSA